MENVKQKFLQSHFLQRDHQGFLKDVEVQLIDKTQASDPTKRKFYWMRTLNISGLFRLIHTFTVMFGSPSTRVLSSVTVTTFC